ncbi:hypothetical protein OS493_015486 [Desmophyllum pertusum]|uniref:ABC transmembrane type-1 domain-containing protein n=1 Tax=Desmophyllum pertusum TaxID=174260 RepID=A0A9W9Z494_9CNID|nr:hypothetical protein OS493_015486 [Desmophyllum pertusum]
MKTYKYSKLKEIRNATTKDEYKQTGNIFSRITIERAKDGSLDENSLGEVLDMKSTEEVTDKLQDEWKIEADRASTTGNSPRLWKAVCKLVETGVIVRSLFFGILDSGDYGLWIDREVQVRDLNWEEDVDLSLSNENCTEVEKLLSLELGTSGTSAALQPTNLILVIVFGLIAVLPEGIIPFVVITVYIGVKGFHPAREIKRTENITNTLVYEHISDCIQGVMSIRGHGMEKEFNDKHHRNQDINNKALAASMFIFRWTAFRLTLVNTFLVTVVVVTSLILVKDPALCGLVISFVIQLNKKLSAVCFHLSFSDTAMVSVERVLSYTKLEPEIGYGRETFPAKLWPEDGAVTLKNLSLAYYPNGPQVLKDLSCSIASSEKVNNVVLFLLFWGQ